MAGQRLANMDINVNSASQAQHGQSMHHRLSRCLEGYQDTGQKLRQLHIADPCDITIHIGAGV